MKRFVPIAAALTCVLLVLAFQFVMTASVEHPHSDGERLSIAGLRPNEEIVVSTLFSHRTARGREYRIRGEGARRTVAIFDTTPGWSREDGKDGEILLFMRDLSTAEIEGLDETVAYCREVRKEVSSATKHMHLRYLRGGRQVGEEFYLGFSLPSQMTWSRRQVMNRADLAREYADFAQTYRVSIERLYRMMPFEMLEQEEPNQSLQPTALLGRG